MSETSPSTPQPSTQLMARENMQREILSRFLPYVVLALLVIVVFGIAPSIIMVISYARTSSTISPSPTATVTAQQLQDFSNRADQQLLQMNGLLTLVTSFATVMGVVLGIFAVVTVGLGAFGFFTNNGFRDLEEKWRQSLAKTEEKGKVIDEIQEEIKTKQKDIDDLHQTLIELEQKIKKEVTDVEKQFENTNRALTLLILGNQLLEQGRREQAVEAFERAQRLSSEDPQINYTLGRAYSGVGAYDKAIEYLSKAIDLDPNFPQAHMELGLADRRQGNKFYEEAVLTEDQARKRILRSRAEADYEQAVEHLKRAIELRPGYEDALATLGGLYRRLGDYEDNPAYYRQALEYYEKASKAEPNSSYALGNLASLSWYFEEYEPALAAFARTQEIARIRIDKKVRPDEVYWDYYDLALALLALEETEPAKETYREAIAKTPSLVDFDGVLSNLHLLQRASRRMQGLDEFVKMVEDARDAKRVQSRNK